MSGDNHVLLLLLPVFPLLGATINGLFGGIIQRRFGRTPIHVVGVLMPLVSAVLAWTLFFRLFSVPAEDRVVEAVAWDWIHVGFVDARFAFLLDPLSSVMTLIITTIGTLIHVYSIGYMSTERSYWRFFSYLNLFVTMMLILVLGDNFLLMFIGWEGVGLASYLLIGFWYQDVKNAGAGMKAFVVNRFGDACFVIGLFSLFWGIQNTMHPGTSPSANKALAREARVIERQVDPVAGSAVISGEDGASEKGTKEAGSKEMLGLGSAGASDRATGQAVEVQELGSNYTGDHVLSSLTFRRLRPYFEQEGEILARSSLGQDESELGARLNWHDTHGHLWKRTSIIDETIFGIPLLFAVCLLFFLGATAKSAQIPFYVWLPDAMAGPTPVSALIHAATMVTAGVYMIARLNFIFVLSPGACTVIGAVGAATALFAATMGCFQYDIKKVLAYSTVSQLGFMFIGVGVGAYWVGVFHLLTHACFKACLFLCSGSVILGCHHEQDMRRMGGLKKYMPSTHWTYFIACVTIAGFPPLAAFCSKDEILWSAFTSAAVFPGANTAIWLIGLIAATLTSFYMFRSYYMTFTGTYRGNDQPLVDPYPSDTARAAHLLQPAPLAGPSAELLATLAEHAAEHGQEHATGHSDPHASEHANVHADTHADTHAAAHAHGHDEHHDHGDEHAHGHDDGHGDGHGGLPKESPWTMTLPLWVLASASVVLGVVVGFPELLSHAFHLNVHPWLESWFEGPLAVAHETMEIYRETRPTTYLFGSDGLGTEAVLAILSVLVATLGLLFARWLYKDGANPIPALLLSNPKEGAKQIPGLSLLPASLIRATHRVVYNKYFVDELYYAVIVEGGRRVWTFLSNVDKYVIDGIVNGVGYAGRALGYLQGAMDKFIVDGAVGLVATLVQRGGSRLQTLQTGQIRNYLVIMFGGATVAFLILFALSSRS